METIASFKVDHNTLTKGLYTSRIDGNIITMDLRFRTPHKDLILTNTQLHSVEHLVATLLRNSEHADSIIYFGPMGCQTGFYLIFNYNNLSYTAALSFIKNIFKKASLYNGKMPGNSHKECGHPETLDLNEAKKCCSEYYEVIKDWTLPELAYKT